MALAVHTRLLTTENYGRYALVVSGVGYHHVVFFLLLPACLENRTLSSGVVQLSEAVGLGLILLWHDPTLWGWYSWRCRCFGRFDIEAGTCPTVGL